jgi:uncharacterized protein YecE (DUF72 family)
MPLYAGTSGFAYKSWKPAFYPPDLPTNRFLTYYSERLTALEVNYTFRRLASPGIFERWLDETRSTLQFVPKAHMRITHIDKLKNTSGFLEKFLESLAPFENRRRLGPILFQLAPSFRSSPDVLEGFLKMCPPRFQYAFEFRHESWFNEDVYSIVKSFNAAVCRAESEKLETPAVDTASFAYYRMRKENYTPEELQAFGSSLRERLNRSDDVYVFFKHEENPEGALYAETLLKMFRAEAHSG